MTSLKVDVRAKPLGYSFGGPRKRPLIVVECPKCHEPALKLDDTTKNKHAVQTWAHTFTLAPATNFGPPDVSYGVLHTLSDAPEEPKHDCGWPGCATPVVLRFWACYAHWYKLPGWLRARIQAAYVPGQKLPPGVATQTYKWIGQLK